ncbi:TerC family protein [Chthonobacter rhizosphaerae]|uniref:TerC family protein n=1 Tax=Chthonobacter rhizosphaerae TaxID=2735553 RepID=UPI0015EF431E|nr:TerC family protein [Chthonobacter rhizosphaerae]
MDFLFLDFLGKPGWMWAAFLSVVVVLLVFDLGVLHRKPHEIGIKESFLLSGFYIALGLAFGGWVWWSLGQEAGLAYVTGFVVEKSLAMDNIFVIAMIFAYFGIPRIHQHRVLVWGIIGVLVLRGIMIAAGAAIVSEFSWVLYIFAAFLIITGIKMIMMADKQHSVGDNPLLKFVRRHLPVTDQLHGDRFTVKLPDPTTGKLKTFVTPLFLALLMVEFADVIFAVDSVPAIFAITTDPYLVYTSNIFAILGLRALYFALAALMHRFVYLKYALASLLIFIGSKIVVADMLGIAKIPPEISLGVTFAILAAGIGASLWKTKGQGPREVEVVHQH